MRGKLGYDPPTGQLIQQVKENQKCFFWSSYVIVFYFLDCVQRTLNLLGRSPPVVSLNEFPLTAGRRGPNTQNTRNRQSIQNLREKKKRNKQRSSPNPQQLLPCNFIPVNNLLFNAHDVIFVAVDQV